MIDPALKGEGFRKFVRKLSWYQQGLLAIASLTPSPPKVAIPTLSNVSLIKQDVGLLVGARASRP